MRVLRALDGGADSVDLTAVIRDFTKDHPDFNVVPRDGYAYYAGNTGLDLDAIELEEELALDLRRHVDEEGHDQEAERRDGRRAPGRGGRGPEGEKSGEHARQSTARTADQRIPAIT